MRRDNNTQRVATCTQLFEFVYGNQTFLFVENTKKYPFSQENIDKLQKYLHMSKKSSTFGGFLEIGSLRPYENITKIQE